MQNLSLKSTRISNFELLQTYLNSPNEQEKQSARKSLKTRVEDYTPDPDAIYCYGLIHLNSGDEEGAFTLFRRAGKLKFLPALFTLAQTCVQECDDIAEPKPQQVKEAAQALFDFLQMYHKHYGEYPPRSQKVLLQINETNLQYALDSLVSLKEKYLSPLPLRLLALVYKRGYATGKQNLELSKIYERQYASELKERVGLLLNVSNKSSLYVGLTRGLFSSLPGGLEEMRKIAISTFNPFKASDPVKAWGGIREIAEKRLVPSLVNNSYYKLTRHDLIEALYKAIDDDDKKAIKEAINNIVEKKQVEIQEHSIQFEL